ncbi:T9SS type A sorting domain-containing protein [Hymenobacter sp. NST-14]|uniref:T9SS type A sorting domain-containing protein n=1 Tax=Hymenobacter piscis TaxID=2839984 RepID=UPI001C0288AA|nr:T9SS type A sorting domain-containing protein [Hymenobacter piscis]MBT9394425.1 T9SS type A sorting domain-containing protein [Hymenobacter piscis]
MKIFIWLTLLVAGLLSTSPTWAMTVVPSDKDIKAPAVLSRQATLTWTRTAASSPDQQSMVVLQEVGVSDATPLPMSGQFYIANEYFGLGQQIGPGEYVVHADTARIIVVKGLKPGTRYRADVIAFQTDTLAAPFEWQVPPRYAFDRDSSATLYFTTLPAAPIPGPTKAASATQATAINCSTLEVSCRPGNGDGRLMVVQPVQNQADGATKSTTPVDDVYYLASSNYGQGQTVGPDAYVVQAGTDTTLTVYGLPPGGMYKFVVYEYTLEKDAGGNPTGGGITYAQVTDTAYVHVAFCGATEPDRPATNARQTDTTLTTARVVWHNGSGQGRLVVVREFTQGLLQPVQNTVYQGNAAYGLGDQTHPGSYVVMTGQDSVINLTGLQPASLYQLEVYEYNLASDGRPTYLLSQQPASAIVMTAFPPVPVVDSPSRLQLSINQAFTYYNGLVQLHWTPGSGTHYLALVREVRPGRSPLLSPVDGTVYPSNNTQEMGRANHVGKGSYVLWNRNYRTLNDTVVYLRNPRIGHVYEVAVYEYTLDAAGLPEYSSPVTMTFTAGRIAPVLEGKLVGGLPSFKWYTDALYLPVAYELEYSSDGINFSPNGGRQAVGMDSSVTRVTGSQNLAVPLSDPTYYRLRLEHQDLHSEYSNIVRLEPGQPLPVTLTSFTGKVDANSYAQLYWTTAAEVNSAYFELQRSSDGVSFFPVGRRTAAGNSTISRKYTMGDPAMLMATSYYRLRQVDRDSAEHYTNVVSLQPVVQSTVTLTVWPNPAGRNQLGHLRLSGLREWRNPVNVAIYTVHGQLVQRQQVPAGPVVEWSWSLEHFQPGLYLVEVRSEAGRHTARLIIE